MNEHASYAIIKPVTAESAGWYGPMANLVEMLSGDDPILSDTRWFVKSNLSSRPDAD